MGRRAVLAWVTIMLYAVGAAAADLAGTVVDRSTGEPIGGAVVIVKGTALQTVTDAAGRFAVVNRDRPHAPNFGVEVPAGRHTLIVRAAGYFPVTLEGVMASEGIHELVIPMERGYETNFIRVGASGRYFAYEDGRPYVPAGFHHQIVEPDFNAAWDPFDKLGSWWRYDSAKAARFAREIADRGITMIRIFLEEAYILESNWRWALFQDPVGIYNADVVAHWDLLFDWADEYGFKILVSPYHTDQARRNWRYYPFSAQQGGPLGETPDARWFTDEAVKAAQKRDFEYIVDRWGQRDSLFAIDLMNEADTWPGSALYLRPWIDEMADHVRRYMIERWGKAHLITVSAADGLARGHVHTIVNHPQLDFVTTHMYWGSLANPQVVAGGRFKTNVTSPAIEANYTAATILSAMTSPKPYFDTEHGPIGALLPLDQFYPVDGRPSPVVDEFYFHNIIWANFTAGAAGVPTRWGFRPNTPLGYRLTDEMLDDIGRLHRFALLFDLERYRPRSLRHVEIKTDRDDLFITGSIDDDQGMIWVMKRRLPIPDQAEALVEGATLSIPVPVAGHFEVRFFETRSGSVSDPVTVDSEFDRVTIGLPAFEWDVALRVTRIG